MEWYLKVVKNYVGFEGRARRKEYWMFSLISFLIYIAIAIVDSILHTSHALSWLYDLAILLPTLAVSVRRLHDTGKSGWWLLISLIPLVGAIVLLIFACRDSQERENQFGPNPKVA